MSYKITIEADSLDEFHAMIGALASKTKRPRRPTNASKALRKFSDDQIRDIRRMHGQGQGIVNLARQYGVAQGTIQQITDGNTYQDVS